MPIKKKIKISSTKRGHHEKQKKNFGKTKQTIQKEKHERKNIFGPKKTKIVKEIAIKTIRKVVNDTNEEDVDLNDMINMIDYENSENEDIEMLEEQYNLKNFEKNELNTEKVPLLPIKTKTGIVLREEDKVISIDTVKKDSTNDVVPAEDENMDSDNDIIEDLMEKSGKKVKQTVISTAELIAEREEELQSQKFKIGVLCAGILEKPEEKIKNINVLLRMLEERDKEGLLNFLPIRKLVIVSLLEIFKDIIPEYRIGVVDLQHQKVKKDTLGRVHFENSLLDFYKRYLNKLEQISLMLQRKKIGPKVVHSKQELLLAELAVQCLCDILIAHPYFNYNMNVGQLLVVLLNNQNNIVRKSVFNCFVSLFKTDKRYDLTLHIVRHINHLVKKKEHDVFPEVINCLLSLQIKEVNLDAEKEIEIKQKKLEQKKSRAINLSKKERKKKKKIAELEKELMETKAEENKQTKNSKLTDVTKLVFTIYFRCLKKSPGSKLLSGVLEGLAKFTHIINIEYFSDLIEVLHTLLTDYELGYREQLHCIQTVFTILSGQGEVLNIDPARFYTHLYINLLNVHAGKNFDDIESIMETLDIILIKRRKNITHQRCLAFIKRLMTMCLQVLPNAGLGLMGLIRTSLQLNSQLQALLDTESTIGSGQFDPFVDEPEFSNANCTHLYEVTILQRHYHSIVKKYAYHIACGVPTAGNGILPIDLGKLTPTELYNNYDSSNIAFNPPIPTPKDVEAKAKPGIYIFSDGQFEKYCEKFLKAETGTAIGTTSGYEMFNFYKNYKPNQ